MRMGLVSRLMCGFPVGIWIWCMVLLAEGWVILGQWWGLIPAVCGGACITVMIWHRFLDPLLACVVASAGLATAGILTLFSAVAFVTGGGEVPGGDRGVWTQAATTRSGVWVADLFVGNSHGQRYWHVRVHSVLTLGLGWPVIGVAKRGEPPSDLAAGFSLDAKTGCLHVDGGSVPTDMVCVGRSALWVLVVAGLLAGGSWWRRRNVRTPLHARLERTDDG